MPTVTLETVNRSTDEEHLLFLNRIREKQPSKDLLREYFADRHFGRQDLAACIRMGEQLAERYGQPFTWLASTNLGAAEVCSEALRSLGITEDDLELGHLCDPATKSSQRIIAKPGICIRLSRNCDKARGFVNGALATVVEPLRGNAVFVAKLNSTGNYVLVHPMDEDGQRFLPCCYGYATTIRRAQGADLFHGCIYFDQKRAACRGYGYVAVGRFKSRKGCYLYGGMRQTDFLPVGEPSEDEVLERGYSSAESDDEEWGIQFTGDNDCPSDLDVGDDDSSIPHDESRLNDTGFGDDSHVPCFSGDDGEDDGSDECHVAYLSDDNGDNAATITGKTQSIDVDFA